MKTIWTLLSILILAGCQDLGEATQTERKPVMPPGIAPVGQIDGRQPDKGKPPPAGNGGPAAPQAANNQAPARPANANRGQGRKSIIGRRTREIFNAKEELKKPNVAIANTKSSGNNPFNVGTNAYTRAASVAGSAGIQQWINIEKALKDRPPSYAELIAWMKKNPWVELPVLPTGRVYGYNEESGQIVVLETRQQ